ncbi:hypothetical protein B0H17DRAFT_1193478 [Mycena rosella]|uniref:Uncharacterized protein n=1 Tax=Mycena rosella TaxID=1033263 RepID=A0AAD7GTK7_MYCRO|nr:hypothetical protein B0H17DRAFT_1193478 [Mycena rosella]
MHSPCVWPELYQSAYGKVLVTFLLLYLRAGDIPAQAETCCMHTLCQFHMQLALSALMKILQKGWFIEHFMWAWGDIKKWIEYMFREWVKSGMFIGQQSWDHVNGFNMIVPFLGAAVRIPKFTMLLLTQPRKIMIFSMLTFCWSIEADKWFVAEPIHDPAITAAEASSMLVVEEMRAVMETFIKDSRKLPCLFNPGDPTSHPTFDFTRTFKQVCDIMKRTLADTMRMVLTLLRWREHILLHTQ